MTLNKYQMFCKKKIVRILIVLILLLLLSNTITSNHMEEIKYIDRKTENVLTEDVPGEGMLNWLYTKPCGKLSLHALFKRKWFSALGGWYMDRKFSKNRVEKFIDQYNIDMSEYLVSDSKAFKNFNDFFVRKIKDDKRPIGDKIVSPADGKILAFESISDVNKFFVKGSEFTLNSYLQDEDLANNFEEGSMVIIRLAPVDYHRYHFPIDGLTSETVNIKGHYFSVSPLALRKSLEIFLQNKRTYCIVANPTYGNVLISEVGATMVGSILQTYKPGEIKKGEEKGYFKFGGSTLVLLFEKGKVKIDQDLIENTKNGFETRILMGENIAQ